MSTKRDLSAALSGEQRPSANEGVRVRRLDLDRALRPGGTGMLLVAAAVGSLAGLLSICFWWAIQLIESWSLGWLEPALRTWLGAPETLSHLWRTLFPAAGALLMGLVTFFVFRTPERLGVAGIMLDARTRPGSLPVRYLPAMFIASALIIGSGGSAGREAPVVVMGGLLGGWIGRRLGLLTRRRQILMGCGAAAAIAAAFNAPLAGVFFALEVLLEDYSAKAISPVVLASVAGTAVCRAVGGEAHFSVPSYHLASWAEIVLYAGLGLAAGLVAVLFIRGDSLVHMLVARSPLPGILRPVVGALGVGAIALVLPQVMGNGYEHIQSAFTGQLGLQVMVVLVFAKIASTNLTIGSGGWGGDFAPLLFIGAMVGGAYGSTFARALPGLELSPGAYAMVGMGALLTATIRCPITAILLLFELTGSYAVILPVMTACAVATPVARKLMPRGMYHQRLQEMGGPAGELPETRLLASVLVRDVLRREAVTLAAATPFRQILNVIATSDQLVFPVVDRDQRLVGALTFKDLRGHLDAAELADLVVAADVASDEVPPLRLGDTLVEAMRLFAACDLEELPVIEDGTTQRFAGIITRRQAMAARERVLAEWEMEDL